MKLFYILIAAAICHIGSTEVEKDYSSSSDDDDEDIDYKDDGEESDESGNDDICNNCNESQYPCPKVDNAVHRMGYTYTRGLGAYKYYNNKVTWFQANNRCRRDGGYLVILDSRKEEAHLRHLRGKDEPSWIGMHYSVKQRKWRIINGHPIKYFHWAKRPDHPRKKRCVALQKNGIRNRKCKANSLSYFCELHCPRK